MAVRWLRPGAIAVVLGLGVSNPVYATAFDTPVRKISARVGVHRLLVVPVGVNGTGPYPFLLDTGATSSMVSEELSAALGLRPLGHGLQETATAADRVALVAAVLTLGGVRHEGAVIATALGRLRDAVPGIRGVLGQDVLRRSNWWLDYRGGALWEDAGGALMAADLGERLAVHWHGDRPAIDALGPGPRPLRLVLDSAASAPVLFGGDTDVDGERVGEALATTHDSQVSVPLLGVGPLRAGRSAIPRFSAAVLEASGAREEDGLLPTALFDGIYFDNRSGTVVLNPRRATLSAVR
jgi:hypothetical protein